MSKKILSLLLLTVLSVVATSASASLTSLPNSSLWQGYTLYSGELNVSIRLEYAVYDKTNTTDIAGLDAAYAGMSSTGAGRYIYAYQIFSQPGTEHLAVDSFKLLGFNTSGLTGFGSYNDGAAASVDSDGSADDGSSVTWRFESHSLGNGVNSYFLVFSSDASPIAGSYEVTTQDDVPIPDGGGDVPEPATVALLGLGIAGVMRRIKRS